jgi:hypothetical protein
VQGRVWHQNDTKAKIDLNLGLFLINEASILLFKSKLTLLFDQYL